MRSFYVLGFIAFLLLGALQAVYGPAFSALQARFDVSRADVGLIASSHFLGSMLGILAAGGLLKRLELRGLLRVGSALIALGLAGVTFAPAWTFAVVCASLAGFGFGFVSVTFNVGGARLGVRAAGVLNILNACFGLGSILAPLSVSALGGQTWPYALLGLTALGLLLSAGRLPHLPETTVASSGRAPIVPLALFGGFFVLYVGVEAGVGSWMTAHLSDLGVVNAATWTSGFWLAVTIGRLLGAPLALRFKLPRIILSALVLAIVALLLASTPAARFAYLLVGLAIAPLFATTLAWFGQNISTGLAPLVLACGGFGGTLFPWLLGVLSARFGTDVVPFVEAGVAFGALLVALLLRVRLKASAETPAL
ncbi:MFS transporter [Deinococcus yavapaiensis]|uniref:Fucose permease n=1 Tax=Deinococcus yavapaiensis KR-236 TaxID=694435 RepID=A0A318S7K8_9DEIO|nr:MFS transporter [Deinococcus yavapaiensis]PYE54827.1 fucose permease [Deinococcus yavapaiensis KR-236]